MADQKQDQAPPTEEPIPVGQIIFDDVFFLLMLGLVVPTLFYIVWGLWSTSVIPVF
ncbi:MAG TPA: hypothetical protein VJ020_06620 [Anaerolineales bacterium]|nr:hypothetical protein [Anaerolineales bacterium]